MAFCADCATLDAPRENTRRSDCAIRSMTELTGLPYGDAEALALAAGYRPGRGLYGPELRAALAAAGLSLAEQAGISYSDLAADGPGRRFLITGKGRGSAHAWTIIDGIASRPLHGSFRFRAWLVEAA